MDGFRKTGTPADGQLDDGEGGFDVWLAQLDGVYLWWVFVVDGAEEDRREERDDAMVVPVATELFAFVVVRDAGGLVGLVGTACLGVACGPAEAHALREALR